MQSLDAQVEPTKTTKPAMKHARRLKDCLHSVWADRVLHLRLTCWKLSFLISQQRLFTDERILPNRGDANAERLEHLLPKMTDSIAALRLSAANNG